MSVSQKELFKSSEADKWFERNRKSADNATQGISALQHLKSVGYKPSSVLEIGCSSGKYLNEVSQHFSANGAGVDPSSGAIAFGKQKYPSLDLKVGTAESLDFQDSSFDCIIFGFCLYLCDRNDLFKIAYEANRCLKENGVIVIIDFLPPFPYKNGYSHFEGVYSYKMDYSQLFLANPSYSKIYQFIGDHAQGESTYHPNERYGVTIVRKSTDDAYPTEPYS